MDTTTVTHPPTPDTRETRALALHRDPGRQLVLIDRNTDEVPSQDGARTYEVVYGGDVESCTCPDNTYRSAAYVHLMAAAVRRAKRRGATVRRLAALEDRARHELLEDEVRAELVDEAARLRRRLGL